MGAQPQVPLLLLTVLGMVLAGCAQPATEGTPKSSYAPPPTVVDSGAGTGTLRGLVVDDENQPLPGVEIQVADRDAPTVAVAELASDGGGVFLVTGLPAGTYLVYAGKLGYESPPTRSVAVADGQEVEVRLELVRLAVAEATHKTHAYALNFASATCVVTEVTTLCGAYVYTDGGHVSTFPIKEDKTGDLMSLVAETKWVEGTSALPAFFRTDVFSPQQTGVAAPFPSSGQRYYADSNPFHWDNIPESYRSPTYLGISRTGDPLAMHSPERTELNSGTPIDTSGNWIVTVDFYPNGARPAGLYVVVQQRVDAAVTFFFVDAAPSKQWSYFAGP